jgi:hypothetical protein
MMEIERTIREEAKAHAMEVQSLEVVQDSSRGVVAKLAISGDRDAFGKALGQYAFNVDF